MTETSLNASVPSLACAKLSPISARLLARFRSFTELPNQKAPPVFRTTDNIFVLKSLIGKQKQTRQKNKNGRLYCCFVDFKKAFDTVPRAVLWQVLDAHLSDVSVTHVTCRASACTLKDGGHLAKSQTLMLLSTTTLC